ncbi:MAG: hypothetical protein ACOYL8_04055 [Patescibacteria group bacterium]
MSKLLVTPILFHYKYLDELCREAAISLNIDLNNIERYQQFKISIFLNFNRYLMDSLLFLKKEEVENLYSDLAPVMQIADETKTLEIFRKHLDFFNELRFDFLNIIKNI